jgi:hypothetical protein
VEFGLVLVGFGRLVVGFPVDFHQPYGMATGAFGNGQGREGIEVFCEHGHLVTLSCGCRVFIITLPVALSERS